VKRFPKEKIFECELLIAFHMQTNHLHANNMQTNLLPFRTISSVNSVPVGQSLPAGFRNSDQEFRMLE
jgi:hypothetical protein